MPARPSSPGKYETWSPCRNLFSYDPRSRTGPQRSSRGLATPYLTSSAETLEGRRAWCRHWIYLVRQFLNKAFWALIISPIRPIQDQNPSCSVNELIRSTAVPLHLWPLNFWQPDFELTLIVRIGEAQLEIVTSRARSHWHQESPYLLVWIQMHTQACHHNPQLNHKRISTILDKVQCTITEPSVYEPLSRTHWEQCWVPGHKWWLALNCM